MGQTNVSRRAVIQLAGLGVAGLAVGATVLPDWLAPAPPFTNDVFTPTKLRYTLDTFIPLVNQHFSVKTGSRIQTMTLTKVTPQPAAGSRETFSLTFGPGAGHRTFTQGTYALRHPGLGQFPLFLVPTGPPEKADHYVATVSGV